MTDPARTAYEAYCRSSGGKSLVTGDQLPAFDKLPEAIQQAWHDAAMSMVPVKLHAWALSGRIIGIQGTEAAKEPWVRIIISQERLNEVAVVKEFNQLMAPSFIDTHLITKVEYIGPVQGINGIYLSI